MRQLITYIYYSACELEKHSKWGGTIVTVIVLGHSYPFLAMFQSQLPHHTLT